MLDRTHDTYQLWKKINNMVTAWFLNSISKDITDDFLFANTAFELWEELKDRFVKAMDHYCIRYGEKPILIHKEINQ